MKSVLSAQMLMANIPSSGNADGVVPAMPVVHVQPPHTPQRESDDSLGTLIDSIQMVAKLLTKNDIKESAKAREAMDNVFWSTGSRYLGYFKGHAQG